MLPNADPTYLKNQARVLVERPVTDLEEFIEKAIQDNNYPTMQEYLKYFYKYIISQFLIKFL